MSQQNKEINAKLRKIQTELDEIYMEYAKKDFEVKLSHHKRVQKTLDTRDAMLKELPENQLRSYIQKAVSNFEPIQDFFPQKAKESFDTSILKFLKAEFLDEFNMKVTVELYPNEYIEDEMLEKTIYLFEREPEGKEIKWKDEQGACQLFDFFEADNDDLEAFDIFYEFYLNLAFYATSEN